MILAERSENNMAENELLKLKQQIKSGETKNLYLFYGEETYVKEIYEHQLTDIVPEDAFGDFNRIFFNGKDMSLEKIDDALTSFPMMADKKLIVIKNSGIFKSASEEVKEFWQKRLSELPDFVLLIFDEQETDKRSSLFKAASKYGLAVEFKYLKDYEVVSWIMREAQNNGKKISKDSSEYLAGMCDAGLQNVKNELDKLINYCGNEIYKSDIDKVVSRPLSMAIFEITDAIMIKNSDRAISVILRLKENKESAFNILYLLSSAFDKMLLAKLMLSDGASYDAVSSRLKLPRFIAGKYIDGAKRFSVKFLTERICKTADIDLAVKQGEIDEWTALMQYVFECIKDGQ